MSIGRRLGGLTVPQETLLKAAIYIARLRESPLRDHVYRLRLANELLRLIHAFIAKEVHKAVNENKTDPAHVSWEGVGQCLGISKSAAYARYGGKSERAVHESSRND